MMPKAFSERERVVILEALLAHGHRLFTALGLRKTSVEELAAAAGISKGAFYLFFDSKEELFFELLERYEARFKADLLLQIAQSELRPRARMRALLQQALTTWKGEPLFTRFSRAEHEQLFRRLSPERMARHLQSDDLFAETFTQAWAAQGVAVADTPTLVSGLIRSLFFVSIHEDEFADGTYPEVMAALITMLTDRLIPEKEDSDDYRH
jgi:AcrR family transcriptional regulator